MNISLCMIVRDEEENLAGCLDSVKDAIDEIVILDTGSKDRTKEIARRYTEHIYDYVWRDDFAHARNTAFSYASGPYLMWMDADDVMKKSEREKLIALRPALDGSVDAVMMPYVCGSRPDGTPELIFDRERIVRKDAGFCFKGAVHEAMSVGGCVIREDIAVHHMGVHAERSNQRNLRIYERWMASGEPFSARDWCYYGRELVRAGRSEDAEKAFAHTLEMPCWAQLRIDALIQRAYCLLRLKRIDEARAQLLTAAAVDTPRAQLLCALGECEMQAGRDEAAVLWYRAAMQAEKPVGTGEFIQADCYDYIPSMQLCVLLDRLGRVREAAMENERALLARPDDPAAMRNREYFSGKLKGFSAQRKEGCGLAEA